MGNTKLKKNLKSMSSRARALRRMAVDVQNHPNNRMIVDVVALQYLSDIITTHGKTCKKVMKLNYVI